MGFFKGILADPRIEFTSIILDHRQVEFTLVRKSVRNISLSISPDRGLRVTAPHKADISKIYDVLYQKEKWILKHLDKVSSRRKTPGILWLSGKEHSVLVAETSGREKVNVSDDVITVHCKSRSRVNKVLERWYRQEAKRAIATSIEKYSEHFPEIGTVTVKGQRTRWGSCSSKNNLNFNWKLVMAPAEILDYVVVHELCHTVHRNHSRSFWSLVERHDLDYRTHRRWLKENGHNLSLD